MSTTAKRCTGPPPAPRALSLYNGQIARTLLLILSYTPEGGIIDHLTGVHCFTCAEFTGGEDQAQATPDPGKFSPGISDASLIDGCSIPKTLRGCDEVIVSELSATM